MAMTDIPWMIPASTITLSSGFTILDGADERVGHCGYFVTNDGATRSVTHICWSTNFVPTGDDILVQLESVGADGMPGGIIAADRSGTQTVGNADDYKYFETALTTPYTLTSGTWLACTFKMTNTSKSLQICKKATNLNWAWICEDIAGAATWAYGTHAPNVALKCSNGDYLCPGGGGIHSSAGTVSINTGSGPRYIGNKIIAPNSVRLVGAYSTVLDMDYGITIKLVDSSGNVLKGDDASTDMSVAIDAKYRYSTAANYGSIVLFACPKTLSASTAYYLIFSPDTASNTLISYSAFIGAPLKTSARIPTGWTFHYVSSPSSFSITENTERIATIFPIFDQIDIGSGGGGLLTHPGMNGGING